MQKHHELHKTPTSYILNNLNNLKSDRSSNVFIGFKLKIVKFQVKVKIASQNTQTCKCQETNLSNLFANV